MKEKKRAAPSRQEEEQAHNSNDNKVAEAYKVQCCASVLHFKIIREMDARSQKRNDIIPFPEYNRILTWFFHSAKKDREMILDELRELNLIEIVPFHGIKIKRG